MPANMAGKTSCNSSSSMSPSIRQYALNDSSTTKTTTRTDRHGAGTYLPTNAKSELCFPMLSASHELSCTRMRPQREHWAPRSLPGHTNSQLRITLPLVTLLRRSGQASQAGAAETPLQRGEAPSAPLPGTLFFRRSIAGFYCLNMCRLRGPLQALRAARAGQKLLEFDGMRLALLQAGHRKLIISLGLSAGRAAACDAYTMPLCAVQHLPCIVLRKVSLAIAARDA